MKISGHRNTALSTEQIGTAISNPRAMRRAIPRCRGVLAGEDGSFRVRIALTAGIMEIPLSANVTSTGDPLALSVQGEGLANGLTAMITFMPSPSPGTGRLNYNAVLSMRGTIGGLLGKRVENALDKYVQEFLKRIEDWMAEKA